MKVLLLEGKRSLHLRDLDEPKSQSGSKVITVEAVGIGGSEYLGFNNPGIRPLPSAMGHGFSGMTSEGRRVAVYPLSGCGDCEYCLNDQEQLCDEWSLIGVQRHGGFAQKVEVSESQLFSIPDSLSWEQSVFIEPFANAINAWEISGANQSNSIAVIGSGSLGLGVVACAESAGCEYIEVAELSMQRRTAAHALGATQTQKILTRSYDVVFDTVGSEVSRTQAINATKKGGKCIFLGFETPETTINVSAVIRQQKILMGSFVYSSKQFAKAIELAAVCQDRWVENITFNQVEGHLLRYCEGDFSIVKIALRPNL